MGRSPTRNYSRRHLAAKKAMPWFEKTPARFGSWQAVSIRCVRRVVKLSILFAPADTARDIPILNFEVNALGTINLLEATRQHCRDAVCILMSTNKVYGDSPNEIPLKDLEPRYYYSRPEDYAGVSESCRIDQTLHSLFGASKAAADLVAQEYGRYFAMNTCIFRGGWLTRPSHSA